MFSFRVGRRSITVIFHVTSASALLIATVVHLFGGKHVYCLVKTINSYLQWAMQIYKFSDSSIYLKKWKRLDLSNIVPIVSNEF